MDKMECYVAIAGDLRQVVFLSEENQISWPEICILREIHGSGSVTDIKVIGEFAEGDVVSERVRLVAKYSERLVQHIFGSLFGNSLPLTAPADIPRYDDEVIEVVRKPRASKPSKKTPPPSPEAPASSADPFDP